ncbi:MAG TPA: DUF202 domain-containing protein [Thermoanaerobaculia bacterium]|nr:DUF202 domain-containing protein [Thermoanaerobaculia bacterium]
MATETPGSGERKPEHDLRVFFAAERTLLSWVRTAVALMGFGFIVARFGMFIRETGVVADGIARGLFSMSTGVSLILIGVLMNIVASWRHVRLIRALRSGRDTSAALNPTAVTTIAILLAILGLLMAGYVYTAIR